jgi:hypothetical protein
MHHHRTRSSLSPDRETTSKAIHAKGSGIIGMKIMGESQFTTPEQRDASVKYVMNLGTMDAVTIGFKSPAEVDEAIQRIKLAPHVVEAAHPVSQVELEEEHVLGGFIFPV